MRRLRGFRPDAYDDELKNAASMSATLEKLEVQLFVGHHACHPHVLLRGRPSARSESRWNRSCIRSSLRATWTDSGWKGRAC
jgi:hypothetical protein